MNTEKDFNAASGSLHRLVRRCVAAGYQNGNGEGAQIVNDEWWMPRWGCDSLQEIADEREIAGALLQESREAISACFRAISVSSDPDIMLRLEMELGMGGVKNGIGVRLQDFIFA